jgi:hemerythrin-like domain-containing protein
VSVPFLSARAAQPAGDAADFDHPLALLAACHERISARCETLAALTIHLMHHPVDKAASQAAQSVLRYFDIAGALHHDDEERNLFPLLEAALPGGACDLVETLTLEHEELARLWRQLRVPLLALAAGEAASLVAPQVARFIDLHRAHIEFENTHVLPQAAAHLSPADLARLGLAMAARRGVAWPPP